RRTVALAQQILRRVPAPVGRQELRDERAERKSVLINAVESLARLLARDAAEPRAGSVDEYQIARIQQAVGIGDGSIGSRWCMRIASRHDAYRPKGAHVQPHG